MRTVFYIIGIIAGLCGLALIVVAASGKVPRFAGNLAGTFVFLAGVSIIVAGVKNYRGHWSFVTGVALSILGLSALGNYATSGSDLALALIAVAFLTFGVLSFWSGHKLHRCTVALEALGAGAPPGEGKAVCAQCKRIFEISQMIAFQSIHVCAACKPVFLQRLTEGANVK